MENFSQWLEIEMEKRGWLQADLARAADLSTAGISNLINQRRNPGDEVCRSIARAFNYPPDMVFRIAGLLPDIGDKAIPGKDELIHLYSGASAEVRAEILEFARFKTR